MFHSIKLLFIRILHFFFTLNRGVLLGARIQVETENGEVLLVRHTYIGGWHFPGGGIEVGESPSEAAKRELYEEVGIRTLTDFHLKGVYIDRRYTNKDYILLFSARTEDKPRIKNKLEIADAKFYSYDDLPQNIDLGTQFCIEDFSYDSKTSKKRFGLSI